HLFVPRAAYRTNLGGGGAVPGLGTNAPGGAIVYFYLAKAPDSSATVTLEFLDGSGAVVRTATSAPAKPGDPNGFTRLTPTAGLNRFVWDLRHETITRIPGRMLAEGAAGYRVAPGSYQVKLTAGSETVTRTLEVLPDPRAKASPDDVRAEQQVLARLQARMNEVQGFAKRAGAVRDQIRSLIDRTSGLADADTIAKAGRAIVEKIDAVEGKLTNTRGKTFQDVINFRNGIIDQYLNLANAVDQTEAPLTQGMRARLEDLNRLWESNRREVEAILTGDVARLNALVRDKGVPAVVVPEAKR
ncbi:MAG: hypothetical protein ABI647_15030, partial [Gemmatimonadota bacterium]